MKIETQYSQPFEKERNMKELEKKRNELKDELKKLKESFDKEFVNDAFCYITDKNIGEIVDLWEDKVSQETDFFKNIKNFGLQIFSENIEFQDGLSWDPKGEYKIFFDPDPAVPQNASWKDNMKYSIEGRPKYTGNLRLVGDGVEQYFYMGLKTNTLALTPRYSKFVHFFGLPKPSLKDQFHHFLITGRPHPAVNAMIHELVHKSHQYKNSDIEELITEAQAYANDIIDPLSNFESIDVLAKHIANTYDVSQEKAISVIENIIYIYSQGYSTTELAETFAGFSSAIDGEWWLNEKIVKPLLKKENVNKEEKRIIVDNYILQRRIDIQKSRHSFSQVFGEWMNT